MASLLLFNTSFKNKGDALMNDAIMAELGPGHDWSVPANLRFRSRKQTQEYRTCLISDMAGVTWKQRAFNRGVALAAAIATIAGAGVRKRLGVWTPSDIDVAIDVSGYCYGDVWGQEKVNWGTRIYSQLHVAGSRIILMPKTWGPFNQISRLSVRSMLDLVDLVFARDDQSKRLLDAIVSPDARNVRFAPDYTHRLAPSSEDDGNGRRAAYVIPSYRVIDSGVLTKSMYYRLLNDSRRLLKERGFIPKLLIHEVSNDLRFVEDAAELGFLQGDILLIDDPVDLKRTIGSGGAVVTSRLHGLYNALNTAVPVAVIGWVFKYREALRQYDCEECLVDMANPVQSLPSVIQMITDPEEAERLRAKMRKGKEDSERYTGLMWAEIKRLIPQIERPGDVRIGQD